MIRISTVTWLTLSIAMGTALFNISQKTENERHQITSLEHQIAEERESLSILRAEWSYLNQPSRLRELAKKHLDLQGIKNLPIIDDTALSFVEPAVDTPPEENPASVQADIDLQNTKIMQTSNITDQSISTPRAPTLKPSLYRTQTQKVSPVFKPDEPTPHKEKDRVVSQTKKTQGTRDFNDVLSGLN